MIIKTNIMFLFKLGNIKNIDIIRQNLSILNLIILKFKYNSAYNNKIVIHINNNIRIYNKII